MNRILLADDSPHAQRMGERILRDEGYEVVSVTDGETAMLRLADVDPDVLLADVFLPGKSGLELCRYVKNHPKHRHARVILTAGLLEAFNEEEALAAGADAIIKKPFESSVVLESIKPMMEEAERARSVFGSDAGPEPPQPAAWPLASSATPFDAPAADSGQNGDSEPAIPILANPLKAAAVTEEERIRAAVTVALDAAFPSLVDEITAKVLTARKG